jgi:hypothetical protein
MKIIRKIVLALTMVASANLFAANPGSVEEFRYSWRLKGGVRFIAGLMFPTTGVGNLRTTFGDTIHSELLITAPAGKQDGFFSYESQMDERAKTLMTYHGYAWGKKARNERTIFDYVKGLARINKQTPEEVENRVKKLPPSESGEYRDILTAIYFLRQHAKSMNGPIQTTIYTDGREYPVIFRPGVVKPFVVEGKNTTARAFHIVDAPGGKKWSGGVTVWLTNDARRVPVRIEIQQSMASLQLDLQKIESGALLAEL